jgi:4,5-DOPA dioxygenase extradiol
MNARMPAVFIGHGSPMNAVTDNVFSREWRALGEALPTPRAILCVSAHWETATTQVCNVAAPETIHDFYGFPKALFDVNYRAPGAPAVAARLRELSDGVITETGEWGLDHGAWQVLVHMFPKANIPVAQLSLARSLSASAHFELARTLKPLRDEGVLILGSGNIVHNLRLAGQSETPAWARAFDSYVATALENGDDDALCNISRAGESARVAVPTPEHYLPLLYIAAVGADHEKPQHHTPQFDWGSISMRSVSYGLSV